jgi:Protein of unknown function (DUF664)
VTDAENSWIDRVLGTDSADPTDFAGYLAGFHLQPDETLAGVLALYEDAAARTDEVMAGVTDLDRDVPVAQGVAWFPESATVRWVLLHLIEETARHAGHADIVRESIDGGTAYPLMAAAEGWPASPWMQPWEPALVPA